MNLIRKDFLLNLGKSNPTDDDYKIISNMDDQALLKSIVPKLRARGMSLQAIANRYSVSHRVIRNIWDKSKSVT